MVIVLAPRARHASRRGFGLVDAAEKRGARLRLPFRAVPGRGAAVAFRVLVRPMKASGPFGNLLNISSLGTHLIPEPS